MLLATGRVCSQRCFDHGGVPRRHHLRVDAHGLARLPPPKALDLCGCRHRQRRCGHRHAPPVLSNERRGLDAERQCAQFRWYIAEVHVVNGAPSARKRATLVASLVGMRARARI
eukprot:3366364-Prymnesium_polylepis.1